MGSGFVAEKVRNCEETDEGSIHPGEEVRNTASCDLRGIWNSIIPIVASTVHLEKKLGFLFSNS